MDFYEVFQEILEEKGITVADAARRCGLTDSTLRSITLRKQKKIALEVAFKISEGLQVSLERLNGLPEKHEQRNNNSRRDSAFMEKYRSLDDAGKRMVECVIQHELERMNQITQTPPLESDPQL